MKTSSTFTISPLFILLWTFIILKLCKVITWSWIWVFSPVWVPMAIVGVLLVIILFLLMLKAVLE